MHNRFDNNARSNSHAHKFWSIFHPQSLILWWHRVLSVLWPSHFLCVLHGLLSVSQWQHLGEKFLFSHQAMKTHPHIYLSYGFALVSKIFSLGMNSENLGLKRLSPYVWILNFSQDPYRQLQLWTHVAPQKWHNDMSTDLDVWISCSLGLEPYKNLKQILAQVFWGGTAPLCWRRWRICSWLQSIFSCAQWSLGLLVSSWKGRNRNQTLAAPGMVARMGCPWAMARFLGLGKKVDRWTRWRHGNMNVSSFQHVQPSSIVLMWGHFGSRTIDAKSWRF